jgi:hypothetical protein
MTENWKYVPYRNRKILNAAKDSFCMNCGAHDGTVVAAHSNAIVHGKGMGKKSDDCFVAFLCASCHTRYDTGKMEDWMFYGAMWKTWRHLLTTGVLK